MRHPPSSDLGGALPHGGRALSPETSWQLWVAICLELRCSGHFHLDTLATLGSDMPCEDDGDDYEYDDDADDDNEDDGDDDDDDGDDGDDDDDDDDGDER